MRGWVVRLGAELSGRCLGADVLVVYSQMLFEISRADVGQGCFHRSHFGCVVGSKVRDERHVTVEVGDVGSHDDEQQNWEELVLVPEKER